MTDMRRLEHLVATGTRVLSRLSDGVTAVALAGVVVLIAWAVPRVFVMMGLG